ncbi:MAG: ATP-binding protein [Cyclobacteriaceae bacterium]
MPELAMGATILIRDRKIDPSSNNHQEEFWYSGRIVGLRSISPFNPERTSMLYREDEEMDPTRPLEEVNGPHTHQPMVIQVALSNEINRSEDLFESKFRFSAIQRPPSGRSRLFFPRLDKIDEDNSPTLRDILQVSDKGIDLGMIGFGNKPYGANSRKFIEYKWNVDKLDNKHIFIVGESGSGKTVLLKNLAYQLRKHDQRNRIILTDVQGDISQMILWDKEQKLKALGWQENVSDIDYQDAKAIIGRIRLIVPIIGGNYSTDDHIEHLSRFANTESHVDLRKISLRFRDLNSPADASYLYSHMTSSPQAADLLEDLVEGLKNLDEPVTLTRLQSAISRLLKRNTGNQISLPTSGGVSYYRSTFEACRRILKHLEKYFDLDAVAQEEDKDPLDDFNYQGTTILYLDHLNQEERFLWEMQLVNWLYQNKREMQHSYVFIDEAHQMIPADKFAGSGSSSEVFNRLRSNFEKLAREGRKFRINLILSTQSPQDLHAIVPEQCPTKIVMKINPKNHRAATLDRELAFVANSFTQGQFWIQSPFNGTPDWVRVHSVVPPVPHESMDEYQDRLDELH